MRSNNRLLTERQIDGILEEIGTCLRAMTSSSDRQNAADRLLTLDNTLLSIQDGISLLEMELAKTAGENTELLRRIVKLEAIVTKERKNER